MSSTAKSWEKERKEPERSYNLPHWEDSEKTGLLLITHVYFYVETLHHLFGWYTNEKLVENRRHVLKHLLWSIKTTKTTDLFALKHNLLQNGLVWIAAPLMLFYVFGFQSYMNPYMKS